MKTNKTQKIVSIALLIVLQVVLGRFAGIKTPITSISFAFLPLVLTAILFGSIPAMASAAISDILGAFLFPMGPYFPGFTLSAALSGLVYGLFLYDKPQKLWRIGLSVLIVDIFISLVLSTYWVYIISGKGFLALLPARVTQILIMIPLKMLVIPLVGYRIVPFAQRKDRRRK